MARKIYFCKPNEVVKDEYKDLAMLHNQLARKVWVGAIKIPLHLFLFQDRFHEGGRMIRVSLRSDYYANFSAGTLNIINAYFDNVREAVKFAKRLQKRFNVTSIEI